MLVEIRLLKKPSQCAGIGGGYGCYSTRRGSVLGGRTERQKELPDTALPRRARRHRTSLKGTRNLRVCKTYINEEI